MQGRLIGGFFIGVTFLLPGVSGGALAASLGYYEAAIEAVSGFFRDIKKNVAYLLPLCVGGAVGVLISAVLLARWMTSAETQVISLLLGMVMGSLPSLWRTAHPERPRPKHWALMAASTALTLALFFLEMFLPEGKTQQVGVLQAMIGGGIIGVGTVIPGISGSFLLLFLGWYQPLMNALATINLPIIAAVGVGFLLVVALLIKAAGWLFRHYRRNMFCLVIGFVMGSMALVFPRDFFGHLWWVNTLLVAVGIGVGLALGRLQKAKTNEQGG